MSEVKRYYVDAVFDNPHPQAFIQDPVVLASDYDAAQERIRALEEELAACQEDNERLYRTFAALSLEIPDE